MQKVRKTFERLEPVLMNLLGMLDLDWEKRSPGIVSKWKVWPFWIELHASKLVPEVHHLL
jgi:hypothetical protein